MSLNKLQMKKRTETMIFKMNVGLLLVYFLFSLALAQVDKATGTITNDDTMARLRVAHLVFGAIYATTPR
jgi:hypothetical protein